jgi:hypothetical protein
VARALAASRATADSLTASSTASRSTALTRSLSDSLSVAELLARAGAESRSTADTFALASAATRAAAVARVLTDSLTFGTAAQGIVVAVPVDLHVAAAIAAMNEATANARRVTRATADMSAPMVATRVRRVTAAVTGQQPVTTTTARTDALD